VTEPARGRTRRLVATLRHEGPSALGAALAHGVRWRSRRVENKLRTGLGRLQLAREQRRVRRLNEAPTGGVAVADPQVAVIVTSRDRAELLGLALRSVQLQDFTDWECVVVDDASLDDAVYVAQTFAAVDPRIIIVAHDRPRGLSASRNTGLAIARAPLVCFLDDDDILLVGSLRSRFEALRDTPPDVAGAYCDWVGIDPHDRLERISPPRRPRSLHGVAFADLGAGAPFISSSPLVRREVLCGAGGFDEDLPRAEDVDMWMRIARAGFRFVYSRSIGIGYRRSPGSLVIGSPELQLECLLRVLRTADRPLVETAGARSSEDARTLSEASFEFAYAPQILNYLALIAASDVERAVEVGCRELSEPFRRRIEPERYVESLTASASRRLGRRTADEIDLVRDRVGSVLRRLVASVPPFHPAAGTRLPEEALRKRSQRIVVPSTATSGLASSFDGSVILIAEAVYHVDELGPLHDVLVDRGVKARFMASGRQLDTTTSALGRYVDEILPYDPDLATRGAALVTLNDWGYSYQAVELCNAAGVPTFAKVEGVQDFEDVDTGRQRNAYRTAAVILGQGQNDCDALPNRHVRIVGSTRLERIWQAAPASPGEGAVINLNFTYSVLTDQRRAWLKSVEEAVQRAGIAAVVSRHPAERRVPSALPVTSKPFRFEINRAGVLVSRFSTTPFEAMARGVPFVYHNPHGERVPTFDQPRGAFLVTRSADELAEALVMSMDWRTEYRERAEKFFRRQIDIDDSRPAEVRAADVIIEEIARAR
jgi:hypothetical protein